MNRTFIGTGIGRRIEIDRMEIVLPASAAGRESTTVLTALACSTAQQLAESLADSSLPQRASMGRIEVSLPHGPLSAKAIARAVERRIRRAASVPQGQNAEQQPRTQQQPSAQQHAGPASPTNTSPPRANTAAAARGRS